MTSILTKICTKCNAEKSLAEFYKNRTGLFGKASICKLCEKIKNGTYYTDNLDKVKANSQRWKKKNPEKVFLSRTHYHKNNPEKYTASSRKYRNKNKEKICRNQRLLYSSDRGSLNNRMRRGILFALKKGIKSGRKWEVLVGYTCNDLKKHLEKLFTKGMSWKRFLNGEIHIDHKIPISVFNFTKPEHEDFKRCWSLDNLQPLWAKDNLRKNNRLSNHFQPSLLF